jgi:hypothetical protein
MLKCALGLLRCHAPFASFLLHVMIHHVFYKTFYSNPGTSLCVCSIQGGPSCAHVLQHATALPTLLEVLVQRRDHHRSLFVLVDCVHRGAPGLPLPWQMTCKDMLANACMLGTAFAS